jgi:predicted dehydrogenase
MKDFSPRRRNTMVTESNSSPSSSSADGRSRPIRYAVVGLGHIAQAAVLPAFAHAENSRLTALVSDDATKLAELGKKYKIKQGYSYEQYDDCLANEEVDAVFIALPNHLHEEFTVRAAESGKHILCEKPMAVTEPACQRMIHAAESSDVRLMIAYRLHFEEANLRAIEIVKSGQLGEPRYFQSAFSMQVKQGDIRLRHETGGGTLYDIGIYCINAARYLFQAEPEEVLAASVSGNDARFSQVDEATTGILRFPGNRLASFTASFGAADVSSYRIVGTEGDLRAEPAYEYAGKLAHHLTIAGKTKKQVFRKRDQFAAELLHFSDCVQHGREPEPCGREGLADVRIIEALYLSALEGRAVQLDPVEQPRRPDMDQEIHRPPVDEPTLVHTSSPH